MRYIAIFLLLSLVLTTPAWAVDVSGVEQALPEAAQEILGEATVQDAAEGGFFRQIWQWALSGLGKRLSEAARSAAVALAVALLCSVAGALSADGKAPGYALLGGALAIMGTCAGDMRSFLSQAQQALLQLQDFSKALLPCIAAASAAGGRAASAAAKYAASALFFDFLMTMGLELVLPMIYGYAAASVANAALPAGALGGPVKLMSWVCSTLLAGLTGAFTLALTVTGAIAGNADKVAGSIAKTAISAALPVVGSILADAADSYLAGAALLRSTVGVFGLGVVLCVCLGPVLSLGLHYLLFKAAACVAEPFAEGRLSALIGNIGTAYGMALGLVGSGGIMLFVSIALSAEVMGG